MRQNTRSKLISVRTPFDRFQDVWSQYYKHAMSVAEGGVSLL